MRRRRAGGGRAIKGLVGLLFGAIAKLFGRAGGRN